MSYQEELSCKALKICYAKLRCYIDNDETTKTALCSKILCFENECDVNKKKEMETEGERDRKYHFPYLHVFQMIQKRRKILHNREQSKYHQS